MTPAQAELLDFLRGWFATCDVSPSFGDIQGATGMKSRSAVFSPLNELERQGYIVRDKGRARSIRMATRDETCTMALGALRQSILTVDRGGVEVAVYFRTMEAKAGFLAAVAAMEKGAA